MKPFDIELAKAGHPVCTRDGRPVRIVCFDFLSHGNRQIIGLVRLNEGQEGITCYKSDGQNFDFSMFELDLMMAGEKKEGWINIYEGGIVSSIYATEKIALFNKIEDRYITTIKIEWEE